MCMELVTVRLAFYNFKRSTRTMFITTKIYDLFSRYGWWEQGVLCIVLNSSYSLYKQEMNI